MSVTDTLQRSLMVARRQQDTGDGPQHAACFETTGASTLGHFAKQEWAKTPCLWHFRPSQRSVDRSM